MKRKVFILTLACLIVFAMMPVYAFGATKIVKTYEANYFKVDGEWQLDDYTDYTYNQKGLETQRIKESFIYYGEGEYEQFRYITKTKYDSKNRIKQIINNNVYDKEYYKDVYTYTTKNRIKKIQHYYKKGKNASYKNDGYTVYTYSTTKKKNTIKKYNAKGKLVEKTIEHLNSKNRVKTSEYYERDGGKMALEYKFTYTYYTSGKVKKQVQDTGYVIWTTYYDEKGRVKKERTELDDGAWDETVLTYDSYGRLKKEVTKGKNGDMDTDFRKDYTYKGYFKKHKYPKKVLVYWDGKKTATEKSEYEYKTIG